MLNQVTLAALGFVLSSALMMAAAMPMAPLLPPNLASADSQWPPIALPFGVSQPSDQFKSLIETRSLDVKVDAATPPEATKQAPEVQAPAAPESTKQAATATATATAADQPQSQAQPQSQPQQHPQAEQQQQQQQQPSSPSQSQDLGMLPFDFPLDQIPDTMLAAGPDFADIQLPQDLDMALGLTQAPGDGLNPFGNLDFNL